MSERYTAPCPHFRQCGGCQLQNRPYPQQLRRKQKQLEELLGEFAPVRPILRSLARQVPKKTPPAGFF